MNSFSSVCPEARPLGSVTLRSLFFPARSTMKPFDSRTLMRGGSADPSRWGSEGRKRSPPRAHAIASSTLVLPWPFFPPITVSPVCVGV